MALIAFQALCPHSVAVAIPQAKRIHETFEPNDVSVIGLHATFEHHEAYSHATLKAFIQEYRLKFPIALDSPIRPARFRRPWTATRCAVHRAWC